MSRKGFRCPNCGSEFCSAIQYWKPRKELVTGTFDAYKCHDCGQLTDPGTMSKLPVDWQPPRKVLPSQPDLFGNVANIRDTIKIVPRIVESYAGLSVSVGFIPDGSTQQYRDEVEKMRRELVPAKSGRELPAWYKYRTIKRAKK